MSGPANPHHAHEDESPAPKLDTKRQTKYFLRCLKTLLPQPYTSNDSNRLSLAFFIIAALDLLDTLHASTTPQERSDYTDWIYLNQHPEGGFRGFPGSNLGATAKEDGATWDPAHVPATYFALCLLLILEDDFARLKRTECLAWLPKVQRDDGSFGETLVGGSIQGGRDARFGYCAAGVRFILTGGKPVDGVRDIAVESLVNCICSAESYDGGISFAPYHEAQAGFTFCGLGAFTFLRRLNSLDSTHVKLTAKHDTKGPSNPLATIRWLAARQTTIITDEDAVLESKRAVNVHMPAQSGPKPSQWDLLPQTKPSFDVKPDGHLPSPWAGFNGRCNKVADTCYGFWVGGALAILGQKDLISRDSARRWLLERTAHPALGGFGKIAGDLPDIYHSYLGLATLSLMQNAGVDDGLLELDAAMCVSKRARDGLGHLWKTWGVSVDEDV